MDLEVIFVGWVKLAKSIYDRYCYIVFAESSPPIRTPYIGQMEWGRWARKFVVRGWFRAIVVGEEASCRGVCGGMVGDLGGGFRSGRGLRARVYDLQTVVVAQPQAQWEWTERSSGRGDQSDGAVTGDVSEHLSLEGSW